ncbi:MAG: helix-turn-helix domain-containing protein [Anaerolineales bacterium]
MGAQADGGSERILQATVELLRAGGAAGLTVRQIAEKADVGVGLINYHFGTKARLLEAAAEQMLAVGGESDSAGLGTRLDPDTRLRRLLRARMRWLEADPALAALLAQEVLTTGDLAQAETLLGPLVDGQGRRRTEMELRMLALLLWSFPAVLALHSESFGRFLGVDLRQWPGRETALDVLTRLLLGSSSAAADLR